MYNLTFYIKYAYEKRLNYVDYYSIWCILPSSPFLWLMVSTRIHLQFLDFVFVLASGFSLLQFSLLIMQQLWTDLQLRSSKAHYLFICNLGFSLQDKLYKFAFLLHFFKCISIYAYINWVASKFTIILKLLLDLAYVFSAFCQEKDCIITIEIVSVQCYKWLFTIQMVTVLNYLLKEAC